MKGRGQGPQHGGERRVHCAACLPDRAENRLSVPSYKGELPTGPREGSRARSKNVPRCAWASTYGERGSTKTTQWLCHACIIVIIIIIFIFIFIIAITITITIIIVIIIITTIITTTNFIIVIFLIITTIFLSIITALVCPWVRVGAAKSAPYSN